MTLKHEVFSLPEAVSIMEPQDGWGWRGPPPKQGHLQPIAQDHIQTAFDYLQGQRLEGACICLVTLYIKAKQDDFANQK